MTIPPGLLAGRTALITGAAGGLGTAEVKGFVAAGARVLALDVDEAAGARLAAAVPGLRFDAVDLADLDGLRSRLDHLVAEAGGVDILVNNAAIYPAKPFDQFTLAEHQAVQRVNVDAAMVATQAMLPHMRAQAWGRVINVTSVTLSGGWARLMPYVTSKGAMLGMTRALARELGADGITVNAVAPGAFPTAAEAIHPDPEGYARFVLDHQSIKRRGDPADIAAAMVFLASDMASFVTGQTLNVDGGWWMG